MKIIRHRTPTEECFLVWINNYPETFHVLSEKNFYQFAHCVFSYRSIKWLDKNYFKTRILELKPHFQPCNIDKKLLMKTKKLAFFMLKYI